MKKIVAAVVIVLILIVGVLSLRGAKKAPSTRAIKAEVGPIAVEFRETGTVSPRNRLEIKPPLSGRIENVLVVEGQKVKKGEVIAWMSSTDRAVLLDAARSKGEQELKKWEDTYKPTPIVAPLDGFIIVRSKEPGQTVTTGDVIAVMADTLIVEADVDETDLRYIKLGQKVGISLDAYPDKMFGGLVEHVAYESEVVNNVTVYKVKIRPMGTPDTFRAGMTATVKVVADRKDDALLLPADAVVDKDGKKYVMIKTGDAKPEMREITTGINNGRNIEVVSGISTDDMILVGGKTARKDGRASMPRMGGIPGMGRR